MASKQPVAKVAREARVFRCAMTVTVQIEVTDARAIYRVTGPDGSDWRRHYYPLFTEEDVLEHLALNALVNHVTSASQLDGWADLPRDAVTMHVVPALATLDPSVDTPVREVPAAAAKKGGR